MDMIKITVLLIEDYLPIMLDHTGRSNIDQRFRFCTLVKEEI